MSGASFGIDQDQAIAFVEALTGSVALGPTTSAPKSPHAQTVLSGVLGSASLPYGTDIHNWASGKPVPGYPGKLAKFVRYLRATADALETLLPREDGGKR